MNIVSKWAQEFCVSRNTNNVVKLYKVIIDAGILRWFSSWFSSLSKNTQVSQASEDTRKSKELCLLSPVGSCVMLVLHYF